MWLRGDEQCSMHSHMWRKQMDYQHYAHFFIITAPILAFFPRLFPFFSLHPSILSIITGPRKHWQPFPFPWPSIGHHHSSWPIPLIPLLNDSLQQIVVCLKRTEDLLSEITRPMPEEYSTQVRAWEERWFTRWLKKRVWPSSCLDSTISQFSASAVWYPSSIFLLYTWYLFPVDGESHQSSKSYLLMDGRTVWRGSLRHIRMRISKVRLMRTRVAASMLPSQSLPWEPNWRY